MASTNSIYGLFPGPDSADRGVRALRAAGVAQDQILVMSSEPFDEYSFSRAEHTTIMNHKRELKCFLSGDKT